MLKILVIEDSNIISSLLQEILTRAGYHVKLSKNGVEALVAMEQEPFDALVTDWVMPRMDGIELIRQVRSLFDPVPVILMLTALDTPGAQEYALKAGADDFLSKSLNQNEVLKSLENCFARRFQRSESKNDLSLPVCHQPPFVGVFLTASTGGTEAFSQLFSQFPASDSAAFFIVQQGPAWILATLVKTLQKQTTMAVHLAEEGMPAAAGHIYIAPADRHLCIEPGTLVMRLFDTPHENFVRPSANPLFRSAAIAFGSSCLAVVMTGIGYDGALGTASVAAAHGLVLVQEPDTAVAPTMPQRVLDLGMTALSIPLKDLSQHIQRQVKALAKALDQHKAVSPSQHQPGRLQTEYVFAPAVRKSLRRALVVESSHSARAILKLIIEELGFEAQEAAHGAEALEVIRQREPFQLILVEWLLPVMNGLDFVRELRAEPGCEEIPVLMVSAKTDKESILLALAAGANEYLMKPFTRDMLLDKLNLVLPLAELVRV